MLINFFKQYRDTVKYGGIAILLFALDFLLNRFFPAPDDIQMSVVTLIVTAIAATIAAIAGAIRAGELNSAQKRQAQLYLDNVKELQNEVKIGKTESEAALKSIEDQTNALDSKLAGIVKESIQLTIDNLNFNAQQNIKRIEQGLTRAEEFANAREKKSLKDTKLRLKKIRGTFEKTTQQAKDTLTTRRLSVAFTNFASKALEQFGQVTTEVNRIQAEAREAIQKDLLATRRAGGEEIGRISETTAQRISEARKGGQLNLARLTTQIRADAEARKLAEKKGFQQFRRGVKGEQLQLKTAAAGLQGGTEQLSRSPIFAFITSGISTFFGAGGAGAIAGLAAPPPGTDVPKQGAVDPGQFTLSQITQTGQGAKRR